MIHGKREDLGFNFRRKRQIYGEQGEVSKKISSILKKEFENNENNFFPWLHQRFKYWYEKENMEYL